MGDHGNEGAVGIGGTWGVFWRCEEGGALPSAAGMYKGPL